MGKDKKHHDEQLQEVRSHKHSKLRYLKREQEQEEAKKRLDDYLKHAFRKDDDDPL